MKKGVLLARVSTLRQEKEGLSLEDIQLPELRKYAKENGIEISPENEYVFSESADQKMRKRFNEMVTFLKKHPDVKAVVAYKVDRITRNFRDAVICDELRRDYDKELHFVYDRLIINKHSSGRDISDWDIKVFLAKDQINRQRDYAIESAKTQLTMGKKPGQAPIGYKNITITENHKDIVIDPLNSPFITEIFRLYSTGVQSYSSIAKIMQAKGFRTGKGKIYRSNIEQILNNPFYSGKIKYKGVLYPHNYTRLVDHIVFKECERIKKARSEKQNFKTQYKEFSLRSICVCDYCQRTIGLDTKKNGRLRYLQCNKIKDPNCPQPRLHEKIVLDQIKEDVVRHMLIPEYAAKDVLDKIISDFNSFTKDDRQHVLGLNKKLDQSKKVLKEAYRDSKIGSITNEMYSEIAIDEQALQQELSEQIAKVEEVDVNLIISSEKVISLLKRLPELYERSNAVEKWEMHKLLFSNTSLKQEKLLWKLNKPFDAVLTCSQSDFWLPLMDMFLNRELEIPYSLSELVNLKSALNIYLV